MQEIPERAEKETPEGRTSGEEAGRRNLPLDEVRRLADLLKEKDLAEISVKTGDLEISVRSASAFPASLPPPAAGPPAAASGGESAPGAAQSSENGRYHEVRSPLVGTFYRSPAPNESSFVEVGDRVRAGQTLCIVEAMKLMNEIPADVGGEVVEVHVEDAEGVEFDQPLFSIRPE